MAKPELGTKRQCMSCGAKFYDLSRDPAVCPKCGTPAAAAAMTRVAAPIAARAAPKRVEEEAELEPAGPEMVSLEEVEAEEADKDVPVDDDVEVAETVGGEDTFLEEEEEGEDDEEA